MKEGNKVRIIFHCSDSLFGNSSMLTKWHLQRGWRTIGYHYVILNGQLDGKSYNINFDGWLETGRPIDDDCFIDEWERGAHVKGWNENSIGICLIGKSGKFSASQLYASKLLVCKLKEQFFELSISQHSDWDDQKQYCAGLTEAQINFIND